MEESCGSKEAVRQEKSSVLPYFQNPIPKKAPRFPIMDFNSCITVCDGFSIIRLRSVKDVRRNKKYKT